MKHLVWSLATIVALAPPAAAAAQDPVKTNPEVYRVVFENASVRVLGATVKPGGRTTMHEHPDNVIVAWATRGEIHGAGRQE